ncbi:hypothetical protein CPB84DRAFT_1682116, partial [Gymnopilus junonius]
MWLKSYLNLGPTRPIWALVADALIATNQPTSERNVESEVKFNYFLQSWKTSQVGKIPRTIKGLLTTAKKFGLRPEGLIFSKEIRCSMPIWYHCEANPRLKRMINRTRASLCLRKQHKIKTVGEMEKVADCLNNPQHEDNEMCQCESCCEAGDIEIDCPRPHECFKRAKQILDTLPPKWHPKTLYPIEEEANNNEQNEIWFKKDMIINGNLGDTFRIFTE